MIGTLVVKGLTNTSLSLFYLDFYTLIEKCCVHKTFRAYLTETITCLPVGIYLFKVNNENTRTIIKTPERRHRYLSYDFIVNFQ